MIPRSLLLSGLLVALPAAASGPPQGPAAPPPLTARQFIERIQDRAGGRDSETWRGPTVDTVKAGDLDTPVTGIATTFSATMDVLRRAVARGANLIVAHEPTFYDHLDETAWLGNDPVLEARLEDLARDVKRRLGIRTLRVVGDRDLKVRRVGFAPGAAGRDRQIKALASDDVQVLLVGESREWETVLYVVDAIGQGRPRGLILLGHDVSEELGMKECATWLKAFVSEVPVEYIPAGEPFWAPE